MDQAVLALEGAIAPMDCFLDDHDGRVQCSHSGRRRDVRHQAAVDARADGRHPLAAAHDAGRARRVRRTRDPRRARDHFLKEHMAELQIKNLHVTAADKQILKGVDLHVRPGEFHALMGPNGSGKSTLANAIMGHPNLEVTEGQILFNGEDITEADPDERARAGLFMAFQYPVAIPGVTVAKYLRMVMNAHREGRGEEAISLKDFRKTVEAAMELTSVPREFSNALPQRRLLRRREEAHGDPPARADQAVAGGARRDRLGPGHRRAEHRGRAASTTIAQGTDMGVLIITHYQRILHIVDPAVRAHHVRGPDRQGGRPGARRRARGARATAGSATRSRRPRHEPRGPHLDGVPRPSRARAWSTSTRPPRRRPCGRRSRRWTATTRPTARASTAASTRSPPRPRTPTRARA